MSIQGKIIRLESIEAASQMIELPKNLVDEKKTIVKDLEKVKMLVVRNGKFTFVDTSNENLYKESFQNF